MKILSGIGKVLGSAVLGALVLGGLPGGMDVAAKEQEQQDGAKGQERLEKPIAMPAKLPKWKGKGDKPPRLALAVVGKATLHLGKPDENALHVNGAMGTAAVRVPIEVPPGVAGFEPSLHLVIGNRRGVQRYLDVAGISVLEPCRDAALCLDGIPLVAAPEGSAGEFRLKVDPRTWVRQNGADYHVGDGNGLLQIFEAAGAGRWHLVRAEDRFGNFIQYDYSAETGKIDRIGYGYAGEGAAPLRQVHFYHDRETAALVQVSTRVSGRAVRHYFIEYDNRGLPRHLRDCGQSGAGSLICRPSKSYIWEKQGAADGYWLSSVENGTGGRTDIEYRLLGGEPVVTRFSLFAGEQRMQTREYEHLSPVLENGKLTGFNEFREWSPLRGSGEFTRLGVGPQKGLVVARGMFIKPKGRRTLNRDLIKVTEEQFTYSPLGGRNGAPVVLTEIRSVLFDGDGEEQKASIETRKYDPAGRVKWVSSDKGTDHLEYLDETEPDWRGTAIGNLVTARSHTDRGTGARQTKQWTYQFTEGRLTSSVIRGFENDEEQESRYSVQWLDRQGNIIRIRKDNQESRFSYDPELRTFPTRLTLGQEEGEQIVRLIHDPGTGEMVREYLENGAETVRELDAFGQEISRTERIADPDNLSGLAKDGTLLVVREESRHHRLPDGRIQRRVLTTVSAVGSNDKYQKEAVVTYDALGRIGGMARWEIQPDGSKTLETSLTRRFREDGEDIQITDTAGREQNIRFDAFGRVVREALAGYGVSEFSYNDRGQVSEIIRNGERVGLAHDGEGRLSEKHLPGGKSYRYRYFDTRTDRLAEVNLPSGKVVSYEYTENGQLKGKRVLIPDGPEDFFEFGIDFEYRNDQLSRVLYPDGSVVGYEYEGDRLAAIRWLKGAPDNFGDPDKAIIRYDADADHPQGPALQRILGNGLTEAFQWSDDGALQSIRLGRNGALDRAADDGLDSLAYEFSNQNGKISRESRRALLRDGPQQYERAYDYDSEGRLAAAGSEYSFLNRLIVKNKDKVVRQGAAIDLAYDRHGNVSRKVQGNRHARYQFDVEDRLVQAVQTDRGRETELRFDYGPFGERIEKAVSGGSQTFYISPFFEFTRHADGRMQATRYVWDHMGRVAAFTSAITEDELAGMLPGFAAGRNDMTGGMLSVLGGLSFSHQNLLGLLAVMMGCFAILVLFEKVTGREERRTGAGSASRSLALRASVDGGGGKISRFRQAVTISVMVAFLGAGLAPTAQAALENGDGTPKADQITYFHQDGRGSSYAVSDEAGNQTAAVSYSPFGRVEQGGFTAGNNNFRHKFAGLELDEETGLYYVGQRYYDPELGQFLSVDPARDGREPYEYAGNDPVNYVDTDGRMRQPAPFVHPFSPRSLPIFQRAIGAGNREARLASTFSPSHASTLELLGRNQRQQESEPDEGAEEQAEGSLDWVRYPTFWRWTFGVKEGSRPPAAAVDRQVRPTAEDRAEYNRTVRSGYMSGLTRFGGFLQSLLGSGLLAWWFPTSFTYHNGNTSTPGFWTDLGVYSASLAAFIGFGYGYSGNEALYWQGKANKGANSRDYLEMGLRRIFWKAAVQVIALSGFTLLSRWMRGFPVFEDENSTLQEGLAEVGYLMLKNGVYSITGSLALIPLFSASKAPSATYDSDITTEELDAMPWWRRWAIKGSLSLRGFHAQRGFWARDAAPWSRDAFLQSLWYPIYIVEIYLWFLIASLGYYSGFAAILPALPIFSTRDFFTAWRQNLTLIVLATPASPLAYLNYWARKSMTLIRRRSATNPRTSGLLFKILGPVDGLRIAGFNDASYMAEEDWYNSLLAHRARDAAQEGGSLEEESRSRSSSSRSRSGQGSGGSSPADIESQ
ncbi:RHS repeat-associated core domain-containing protein [Sneathiella chinensis]|uniref:Teneurin-like YD-shell domain-containing protein n=1 Tax=Sneathiella chinensis TaxID=349750 RepID=A0ABQ5U1N7_9PROT|nr:RHS repeat-associated core domain-containing protein [Sneathiella chinensis]GLQ06037.1 hypothetical protein GCM10007924_12580 [Sneathiella chinensis]